MAGIEPASTAVLATCIMPTANRSAMAAQAIRYFLRQDYPAKELLIVYERMDDLPQNAFGNPRIALLCAPPGASIGAKRNLAVAHAGGRVIVQWDDDDWYSANRLRMQIEPLIQGAADITGLTGTLFLDVQEGTCWQAAPAVYQRLFAENVAGGTLCYRREVWEQWARYPDTSLREDADFMQAAIARGARLQRIDGRELFLYVRHGGNTWRFREGREIDATQWRRVGLPACIDADRSFYSVPAAPHATPYVAPPIAQADVAGSGTPLVSCIMPTAERRAFVPMAIRHFLNQDYANKELIIVDDGPEPVEDLIPPGAPIRYLRLEQRQTIGSKRNLACTMARGEIVAHWDDDDWMAPGWLASQVETLLRGAADVCGLDKVLFHAPAQGMAWKYVYDGVRPWVCGGTLCYTRAFWERNKFADVSVGEDNGFVWSQQRKTIVHNPSLRLYVATVHAHNTSPKHTRDRRWHAFPAQEIARIEAVAAARQAQAIY